MGERLFFGVLYVIPVALLGLAFANLWSGSRAEAIPVSLETDPLAVAATPTEPALHSLANQTFYALAETPDRSHVTSRLQSGGTLAEILDDVGVSRVEAAYAIAALRKIYKPRYLRAGQDLHLTLDPVRPSTSGTARVHLAGLVAKVDVERTIMLNRQADGSFVARELIRETKRQLVRAQGNITSSLYLSALEAGASDVAIIEFSRLYAYSVDFQRSIRSGDAFDMVFERFVDERGNHVKTGNLVYARLRPRGRDLQLFRFETPDEEIGYYNEKGESARRFLMQTPIDGARISSSFGPRKHPVLGYNRLHPGTDFAAGTGTPIFAAGNGVVERASRFGSYGHYVRIRHTNNFKTAYAHLSKYGRGIKQGRRVTQGQIIGYVGATGRVTGPHLHYEVEKNGKRVNPMTVKLPSGRKLKSSELPAFEQERLTIEQLIENAVAANDKTAPIKLASDS